MCVNLFLTDFKQHAARRKTEERKGRIISEASASLTHSTRVTGAYVRFGDLSKLTTKGLSVSLSKPSQLI